MKKPKCCRKEMELLIHGYGNEIFKCVVCGKIKRMA